MRHKIFGIPIDNLPESELIIRSRGFLFGEQGRVICTINPEFILQARKDPVFAAELRRCDLALPDGVGLRYAVSALTGASLRYRHTGVDTLLLLADLAEQEGKGMVLLGGHPGSAETASEWLRQGHPHLDVVGIDPGRLDAQPDGFLHILPELLHTILRAQPAVLAVALGQGKQERFMYEVAPHLPSLRIAIGVGGALDMLSGKRPRAPKCLRRAGLEWAWRLALEPRRARRILRAVLVFPVIVAAATLKQQRFLKASRGVLREVMRQLRGL
jgi:N-acetylglucosaminyldiphosphoundecaprenol N-acetyl-beta-D-mannosaminyltransferase